MYESEIKLRDTRTGDEANAKSLLSLLMLGAGHGSELEIIANGKDSKKAVDNLIEFSKTNKSFLRD
jgi:phosphotransferase system HPr (HPr) family protein